MVATRLVKAKEIQVTMQKLSGCHFGPKSALARDKYL